MGALCGYVGVPPEHPFYMRTYGEIDLHAHGGLTFSDHCHGLICHKPEPGEEKDIWWLGFDCSHYQDLTPMLRLLMPRTRSPLADMFGETYRSIDYVRLEVEGLANQVAEAG
jgi:hypothetical protein